MHDIVREPEQMLNGNKLGLFGVVLHSLANGCGPVALTSFSIICCTVSVPKLVHWSSYCFVWSLTGQFFLPFLLSEVGWHPNSSAVNHGVVDTMVTSIALFHYYISDRNCVVYVIRKHSIWFIVTELDPLHGEEGSGHARIHLSCPKVGMLTRPMTVIDGQWRHGNGFLQAFTCSLSLTARCGKLLCYALLLTTNVAKVEGNNVQESSNRMHSIATNH